MRKATSIMMAAAVLMAVLAGCGGTEKDSVKGQEQTEMFAEENQRESASSVESGEDQEKFINEVENPFGKVLVVYYSASGHTGDVARVIAQHTDGDTFELVPVEKYTSEDLNWRQEGSRVNQEHEDESLQDIELVSVTVEDFDSYDTVFLGYPLWWQNASWVVNNFVKGNDFTGKTVIPFCTSTSSGFGNSGKNLEIIAGTGDWKEGERFSERVEEQEVTKWLENFEF